jgi:hypothetical protein
MPMEYEGFERHIIDFNLSSLQRIMKRYSLQIVRHGSNGIVSHSRILWPLILTPTTFGETLIIKAKKIV